MKFILLLSLLLSFSFHTHSQNQSDFTHTIQSAPFDKERVVYVHLPETYYENEHDKFGVLYVLDGQGQSFYKNATGVISYLNWSYQVFPMIIVGIHSDNRGTEFVPQDRKLSLDDPDNDGQAHLLRQHLREEVFPLIESNYRVSEFRGIIGHSRGGAFVANTLFSEDKDLFHAYIGISPGMHYLDNQILNDAEKMIREEADFQKFYYCTHGTVGSLEKAFKPQVNYLDSLFQAHPNNSIHWGKKEIEATTWGCVAPSLVHGILEMSRAYQVDQYLIDQFALSTSKNIKDQIDAYDKKQQARLGYTIPISHARLHYYANQQSEYEHYDKALEIYNIAVEIDPNNVRTLGNMAWAHRQLNQIEEAKQLYRNIVQIIDEGRSDFSEERNNRIKANAQRQLTELD